MLCYSCQELIQCYVPIVPNVCFTRRKVYCVYSLLLENNSTYYSNKCVIICIITYSSKLSSSLQILGFLCRELIDWVCLVRRAAAKQNSLDDVVWLWQTVRSLTVCVPLSLSLSHSLLLCVCVCVCVLPMITIIVPIRVLAFNDINLHTTTKNHSISDSSTAL